MVPAGELAGREDSFDLVGSVDAAVFYATVITLRGELPRWN
jgi:hypothetical protein